MSRGTWKDASLEETLLPMFFVVRIVTVDMKMGGAMNKAMALVGILCLTGMAAPEKPQELKVSVSGIT